MTFKYNKKLVQSMIVSTGILSTTSVLAEEESNQLVSQNQVEYEEITHQNGEVERGSSDSQEETKIYASADLPDNYDGSLPIHRVSDEPPLLRGNVQGFITNVAEHAKSVANSNDLYASVMIAQACLESGYGSSSLSQEPNHNLFGIKGSYNGESVKMLTWEDDGKGNAYWIQANFRKYPSYAESFADNAYVLKNTSFSSGSYYYVGAWKSQTNSYKDATAYLTGRYATDTSYGTKLNNIIQNYNLTQYDTAGTGNNNIGESESGNSNQTSYKVVSGDTLYSIAKKFNLSVAKLKELNNLSSDLIVIGQNLVVGQKTTDNDHSNSGNQESNVGGATYQVVAGDTLFSIAKKNKLSVSELKQLNQLSSDIIYIGQSLKLKKTGGTVTQATYTVKAGDTLFAISRKNNLSVEKIKSLNHKKSDMIFIGEVLRLN